MKTFLLLTPFLLFTVSMVAQATGKSDPSKSKLTAISFPGIKGKIFDGKTGTQLSARIVIKDANDSVYNSYYKSLPGFFTEEDGTIVKGSDTNPDVIIYKLNHEEMKT